MKDREIREQLMKNGLVKPSILERSISKTQQRKNLQRNRVIKPAKEKA